MDGHPQAGWLSRIFLSSLRRWAAVAARSSTVSGLDGPATDPVIRLLDRVVHDVTGRADGRGYLLSCLPLVRRTAGVSVRMVRSLAVCWSMACGPLPVSSRTDGS